MFDSLFLSLAEKRLTPARIDAAVAALGIVHLPPLDDPSRPVVAAASVQMRIFDRLSEYVDNLNQYFALAASRNARLVVLPAFFQLHALSLIPGFGKLTRSRGPQKSGYDLLKTLDERRLALLDLVTCQTVSALCRAYGMLAVTGAGLVRKNGEVRLRSIVFDETGARLGHQDKLYRSAECDDAELTLCDRLSVVSTSIGNLCVLAGGDALEWKCYRAAREAEATIIAAPFALVEPHDPFAAMRDVHARVQYDYAFGVKACLVGGEEMNMKWQGKSVIVAPFKMTPVLDGVLAAASSTHKGSVITAPLDHTVLSEYTDFYTGH